MISKKKIKAKLMLKNGFHRIKSIGDYHEITLLKKQITYSPISAAARKQLLSVLRYGTRYKEYVTEYLGCDVSNITENFISCSNQLTVVCVVKNDLMRMKLFLEYYRGIGVKQFAILDDHSTDGTFDFLQQQDDVLIFISDKPYTTVRRQVWINKMINQIGYNRWYLIVDSDELFDYKNRDTVLISEYILDLERRNIHCVKALLLDMFSAKSLFAENVESYKDICRECNMFLPRYSFSTRTFNIFGGAREELLKSAGEVHAPTASKYPLIYMRDNIIAINSHNNYPYSENEILKAGAVLRHYKFLPQDREKYLKRIEQKNFFNGSKEYLAYFEADKNNTFNSISCNMVEYRGFESVEILDVIGED